MASTIAQIMGGVETRLATISGLNTGDVSPSQVTPPYAFVSVPQIDNYHATMGRARITLPLQVTVLVSAAADRDGQLKLAGYANPTGATSVVTAVEGDKTLGGLVEDCIVRSFRPLGLDEVGAIGYFGGVFDLAVISLGA